MEHKKLLVIQKIKDMHNQSHLSGGSIYELYQLNNIRDAVKLNKLYLI